MSTTTPDAYHRTEDFETRVDSVMLPDEAWAVFAQLDKPTSVPEIARALGFDAAAVQKHIDLLVENKLARKRLVNWRDFLAQKGITTGPTRMSPAGPQPTPAALAAQARRPAPSSAAEAPGARAAAPVAPAAATPTPAAPVSPTRTAPPARRVEPRQIEPELPDPDGTITFRLANEPANRTRRASLAMCITFRLGAAPASRTVRTAPAAAEPIPTPIPPPSPAPAPTPAPLVARSRPAAPIAPVEPAVVPALAPEPVLVAAGGAAIEQPVITATSTSFAPRKLRSVIDAITRKGGGGLKGQLLVYRVFLRVPPALMYAAGIKSLNLVDDALELSDERTYDAIRSAARSVASLELDEVAA